MPYTQIELKSKTFKFTQASGVYTYVNMYGGRISIDATGQVVTYTDFKDNIFEFDITLVTSPVFLTVGDLASYLTTYNVYNGVSQWYNGDSDPDSSFGSNADYFINRINGDIWHKILGTWTLENKSAINGLPSGTTTGIDTYAVTIPGITAYNINTAFTIQFADANTNGSTLDINGLGPISLVKDFDEELVGGDIKAGDELICIYDGTYFHVIGLTTNQLFAFVTNAESVSITKGQVVYAYGATGDRMSVKLAYNTSDATSAKTVGVVYSSSITANGTGYILIQGVISNINLGSYTAGDTLYLSATPGQFTKVKQYAPNHLVYVGIVERANAGNGKAYIRVQNGYELDELHNVQAQSPANNDVLYYDLASTQWKTGNVTGTLQNAKADGTTLGVATFAPAEFNDNGSGVISLDYTNGQSASSSNKGYLSSTDWSTFNNKISGKSFDLTTDQTAVTGTTANTLVTSFNIPANTVKVGDAWELKYRVRKTGVAGVLTITVYVNTSAAIGGTILGIYQTTATALGIMMQRNVIIKTATNTEVMNTGTSNQAFDYLNSTVAYSALNIDWTVQQYLVFTIRNNSTADSSIMSFAEFKTTY